MAKGSINKVILIGNLGRDPEIRYTPNGLAVTNISLATTETWKDKQGEQQEKTEWHRIVMYGRTAEVAGEYLKKGSKIFIEGRLQTRKWQDKNTNQDRYTTEIIGDTMQMLDSKGTSGNNFSPSESSSSSQTENNFAAAPEPISEAVNFNDDIPF